MISTSVSESEEYTQIEVLLYSHHHRKTAEKMQEMIILKIPSRTFCSVDRETVRVHSSALPKGTVYI